jgi:hypothetical protein
MAGYTTFVGATRRTEDMKWARIFALGALGLFDGEYRRWGGAEISP